MDLNCDFGQSIGIFEYLNKNREEFSKLLHDWFNNYKDSFYKRELTPNEQKNCRAKLGIIYNFDCEY